MTERSLQRRKSEFHSFQCNRIDEIIPNRLYLTNYQAITRYPEMIWEMNVDAIVSVLEYTPFSDTEKPDEYKDVSLYHFNIEDSSKENISQFFQKFEDIMNKHNKVVIHCYGGISRSSAIVISHMMNILGSSLEDLDVIDIISLVQKIRPCVNPNPGFVKQLEKYRLEILKKFEK